MNSQRFNNNMELAGAVIMSLAALLTAWCGFQSSRWNGTQNIELAESNLKSSAAMEKTLANNQHYMMDGILTLSFVNAVVEDRQRVVDFYLKRFRPELKPIMRKWLETKPLEDGPYPHPMAIPEYVELVKKQNQESADLRKVAEEKRGIALYAGKISDSYLLLTILFSAVLFLGGIESKFDVRNVKLGLLSLATLLFLFATYRLVLLPLSEG